jgi:hypothetical protein
VNWVFGTIAVTLGILLLWGLVAPRSQWLILRSWAVADPHANEPGGAAYGFIRLGSAIGVLGLALVGIIGATAMVGGPVRVAPGPTQAEIIWGSPAPKLLNRVFVSASAPPAGLAEMPILGYQTFDNGIDDYVLELQPYTRLGDPAPPGILGSEPDDGTSAIGSSNLLVNRARWSSSRPRRRCRSPCTTACRTPPTGRRSTTSPAAIPPTRSPGRC